MKDYIDKIIASNDNQKMLKLRNIVDKMGEYIYDVDEDEYNKINCELYETVYGKVLNEEMCKKWVESMNPPAKWTMEDITNVSKRFSNSIPIHELYVIMNMLHSHYADEIGNDNDDETLRRYMAMAQKWYFDKDAKVSGSEKLYIIYKGIVKG